MAILLILCVLGAGIPLDSSLKVQKAEALFPSFDPNSALSLIQETISATSLNALELKEFTLDGIAYSLAKKAVSQMTSNIVEWINSGFEGNPMFITDLGGFLRDIADQVAGDYIALIGDGFLCSPFQLNVRAALTFHIQKSKTPGAATQCTFSGVMDNLKNFGTGFNNWGDWFEITTRPANNQYGAYMLAQAELSASITNAQGKEIELLRWGQGIMSMEKCDDNGQNCQIVTPGATIKEQLDQHLGAGLASLIEADEIDEIINALFAQLAEKAVTGLNGLLGLSQSGGAGEDSYLDDVRDNAGDDIGFSYSDKDPIQEALNDEIRAASMLTTMVTKVDGAETKLGTCAALSLPKVLKDARDDAKVELTGSDLVITSLTNLNTRYKATKNADAKNDILLEFRAIEAAGQLRSSLDLIGFEVALKNVQEEVDDFEEEIEDKCD